MPDVPVSGPPDPDLAPLSASRATALLVALRAGASPETLRNDFGVTLSGETRRALLAAPAPLHGEVRIGGAEGARHMLYSMGGVLVVAVRAVDA